MKKIILLVLSLAAVCSPVLYGQQFSLSTNFADYADFGTLNLEMSYAVAQHWSLNAGMKYNPFTYNPDGETLQKLQRSLSTGARYWPWHIYSGWWFSGAVRYQEYNIGGISSPQTTEGDRFGGGLGLGYTYMLSPKLNLDIGAGFWSGYDAYTTYSCPRCGRKIGEGRKFFVLPSDILLALSYIF